MAMLGKAKNFWSRTRRPRRHLAALLRYGTPRRLANVLRVEYEMRMRRVAVRGYPYIVVIDGLNSCNLRCPFCPTGTGNLPLGSGKMSPDQFKKIVDQIAPRAFKLILYNWGEPFLHPGILAMTRYAHGKRLATAISSNLNRLPEGGGEAVVRSGLDDLIVSCDGLTQETYARYRVGGSLDRVAENLQEISRAKKRLNSKTPHIEFQFLVFRHNEAEIPRVDEFARRLGANETRLVAPYLNLESADIFPASNPDFVRPQYRDSAAAESDAEADIFSAQADQDACIAAHPPPISCFWPWRSAVINWNGQVDPCCGKNYLRSFGNVLEQPFDEIWNGPAYRRARAWIAGRDSAEGPDKIVCRGCAGYR